MLARYKSHFDSPRPAFPFSPPMVLNAKNQRPKHIQFLASKFIADLFLLYSQNA